MFILRQYLNTVLLQGKDNTMKKIIICLCLILLFGCSNKEKNMQRLRDYLVNDVQVGLSLESSQTNSRSAFKTLYIHFDKYDKKVLSIYMENKETIYKIEYIDKDISQLVYRIDYPNKIDNIEEENIKAVKKSLDFELDNIEITIDELITFSLYCYENGGIYP